MIVLLMGVAGSGKTSIGTLLGESLGWPFYDADDFHPKENIEKMASGIPLTDEDRLPWLLRLRALLEELLAKNQDAILACSALKERYRQILLVEPRQIRLFYLKVTRDVLAKRLSERRGHFISPQLLESQLATLEEPTYGVTLSGEAPLLEIVEQIKGHLVGAA